MTLQKRLLVAILAVTPFAWLLTLGLTYYRTRLEINELYDTDMVRMAQQVQAVLPAFPDWDRLIAHADEAIPTGNLGFAGLGDVAVTAWLPDGRRLPIDPEGDRLPARAGVQGFVDQEFDGNPWRLYYLQAPGKDA